MKKKYMGRALELAEKSYSIGDVPVGAVVVCDGVIIGEGYNRKETDQDATKHAEIIAIKAACKKMKSWRLEKCTLYVTLEPCLMCSGAIIQSRISRVVYGAKSDKFGFVDYIEKIFNNKKHNHKVELIQGEMEVQSRRLLQSFFEKQRNSHFK